MVSVILASWRCFKRRCFLKDVDQDINDDAEASLKLNLLFYFIHLKISMVFIPSVKMLNHWIGILLSFITWFITWFEFHINLFSIISNFEYSIRVQNFNYILFYRFFVQIPSTNISLPLPNYRLGNDTYDTDATLFSWPNDWAYIRAGPNYSFPSLPFIM